MRSLLRSILPLCLLLPAAAFALPPVPGPALPEDVGVHGAKAGGKAKRGGKGADPEPATPPPPPPDGDGDAVPDASDACPEDAEDRDGFEDADGCPDPDNDGDGVLDATDACPSEKENADGWDDQDGCPEPPPKIAPFLIDAILFDGTTLKGKVVRVVAVDEDEPDSVPFEPLGLGLVVDDDAEFEAPWANIASLTSEKVNFTEAVDCYSEGVQKLGDAPIWECTLKHPTVVKLVKTDKKGVHTVLDRAMRRLDLKIDELTCEGPSCEAVKAARGVSWYLYKLIAFKASEDENEAVTELQKGLRATQQRQVKKATLKPVP